MCLTSALTRLLKLTKNLRQKGICRIRVHPAASHFLFTACLRTESASEPNAQLTQLSSLETKPHTGQIHCRSESHTAVLTGVVLLQLHGANTASLLLTTLVSQQAALGAVLHCPRLWLHWPPPLPGCHSSPLHCSCHLLIDSPVAAYSQLTPQSRLQHMIIHTLRPDPFRYLNTSSGLLVQGEG